MTTAALGRGRDRAPGSGDGRAKTVDARRSPQQDRSRAKVDAILDTADAIIADRGLDALTTTIVAERASVAVGTLYQYFDGIPAIIDALVARHAERFAEFLEATLATRSFRRKRDAANAALDALIEYYRRDATFGALWRGSPQATGAGIADASDSLVGIVIAALTAQGLVTTIDEAFVREAQVQWAVATALIEVAFARDPGGDPAVLAHLRRLFDLDVRPA